MRARFTQILVINTTIRNACITGDLSTAQEMLIREIDADANVYSAYSYHSFVMARQSDWDNALHDAVKVGYDCELP